MSNAKLLRQLIKAGIEGDSDSFKAASEAVIREEREKKHHLLANDLERLLYGERSNAGRGHLRLLPAKELPINKDSGLALVEDLGSRWEAETGCPLPLGGIVASRRLPGEVTATAQRVIHDSLELALADPAAALPTMRAHAQEFDDHVLMQHVDLYVNGWTLDLGETGRRALAEFSIRAAAAGRGQGDRLDVLGDE